MKIFLASLALCALQSSAFVIPTSTKAGSVLKMADAGPPDAPVPVNPGPVGGFNPADWMIHRISEVARVEGKSRTTFQFPDVTRDTVQVVAETNGRPMNAEMELWIGPDWTPMKMKCYSEDGELRPVQTLIGTRKKSAQIEVRNTAPYEFPLSAAASYAPPPLDELRERIPEMEQGKYVEGGSVYSVPFDPSAEQIQVFLKTDTRQLNTRVELLNGPNNVKQSYEVFTNNGVLNSLYVVFNAPGGGNTIRLTNLATVEFPCKAYITPL